MSGQTETRYRCPGEDYSIERPIHLARLAEGFVACRNCEHRFDSGLRPTATLATSDCQAAGEPAAAEPTSSHCHGAGPEGLVGVAHNEIDAPRGRQFAAALGSALRFSPTATSDAPRVALAADGRPLTAELLAAASDGLRLSGCRVVESAAATAASLSLSIHHQKLDGGLLIGNSSGAPQMVSLKCWGPNAQPWSAGGQLDQVTAGLAMAGTRTTRHSGGLERIDRGNEYRLELADLFHGLRPLRFVLDTASWPLAEHLRHLISASACQIVPPRMHAAGKVTQAADRKARQAGRSGASPLTAIPVIETFRERRVARLRQQVLDESAAFALWIDGDGDSLDLIDGRGRSASAERLLLALARGLATETKRRGAIVEAESSPGIRRQLATAGVKARESASTREAMFAAMRQSGAALGGGPSGRIWFGGELPHSDALRTIGELLQLLSQSDRPLSEVLEGEP